MINYPKYLFITTGRSGSNYLKRKINEICNPFNDNIFDRWDGTVDTEFAMIKSHIGYFPVSDNAEFGSFNDTLLSFIVNAEKVIFHHRDLRMITLCEMVRPQSNKHATVQHLENFKIDVEKYETKLTERKEAYSILYNLMLAATGKVLRTTFDELKKNPIDFIIHISDWLGLPLTFTDYEWKETPYHLIPNIEEICSIK